MYVVTVVLFLIPILLILLGWRRRIVRNEAMDRPKWRGRCVTAAFVAGIVGALVGMAAKILWLQGGGDPHGMGSTPGIWQQLLIVTWCTYPLTLVLAILGKGKGRVLVIGALATSILAGFLVPILQMD